MALKISDLAPVTQGADTDILSISRRVGSGWASKALTLETLKDYAQEGAGSDPLTPAEIKTAYESNADTNAFTNANKSKLSSIESGATKDQTKADIDGLGIDAETVGGKSVDDFATAAQGDKADSAVQEAPSDSIRHERVNEQWAPSLFQKANGAATADGPISVETTQLAAASFIRTGGASCALYSGNSSSGFAFEEGTKFYIYPQSRSAITSRNFTAFDGTGLYVAPDGGVGVGTPNDPQEKLEVNGAILPGRYTVATLPSTATEGSMAYATDGLKQSESTGNGTGVPVYFSQGGWLRTSDDTTVGA